MSLRRALRVVTAAAAALTLWFAGSAGAAAVAPDSKQAGGALASATFPTSTFPIATSPTSPTSPTAASGYRPQGVAISGGDSGAGGTPIDLPGLYLDSLDRGSTNTGVPGSARYYTVDLIRGETAWFSATMIPPQTRSNANSAQLDLVVSDLQDSPGCEFDDQDYQNESGHVMAPLSVAVTTGTVGGAHWPQECPAGGTFVVAVTRSGNAYPDDALPLELGFRVEPPAVTSGQPTAPATPADGVSVHATGTVQPVTAGYSFDNAPVVGDGRYQDTIRSGQTRYLRVHLGWGQRLSYLITSAHVAAGDGFGVTATTEIFTPLRGEAPQNSDASDYTSGFGGTYNYPLGGTTAAEVRYANRTSDDDDVRPYAVAGDYVLGLTLGFDNSGAAITVPYTVVIDVDGVPQRGPSYAPSAVELPSASDAAVALPGSPSRTSSGSVAAPIAAVVATALLVIVLVVVISRRRTAAAHRPSGSMPTTTGPQRPPQQRTGGPSGPFDPYR